MGQARHPVPQRRSGKHLAAPQEASERGEVVEPHHVELRQVTEQRRHGEPLRELRDPDELGQRGGQQVDLGWYEVQLGAGRKRAEHVERGEIEVQRGVTGQPVHRTKLEVPRGPLDEMDHVAVRDDDALRRAGGPGRKKDVGRILGAVAVVQRVARRTQHILEREGRGERLACGSLPLQPSHRNRAPQPRVRQQPA